MIVVDIKLNNKQTKTKITILKLITLQLLSKDEKHSKTGYKSLISLHVESRFLPRHKIITTLKPTKKEKSTHKLHSLHPFI